MTSNREAAYGFVTLKPTGTTDSLSDQQRAIIAALQEAGHPDVFPLTAGPGEIQIMFGYYKEVESGVNEETIMLDALESLGYSGLFEIVASEIDVVDPLDHWDGIFRKLKDIGDTYLEELGVDPDSLGEDFDITELVIDLLGLMNEPTEEQITRLKQTIDAAVGRASA